MKDRSWKRKLSVILELLGGADLESTPRKYRWSIATLSEWRDHSLAGREAGLKIRDTDPEHEEKMPLKSVGNISVEHELLRENISRLQGSSPSGFSLRSPERPARMQVERARQQRS